MRHHSNFISYLLFWSVLLGGWGLPVSARSDSARLKQSAGVEFPISFQISTTRYFSGFDYHDPVSRADALELERDMISNSKKIMNWSNDNSNDHSDQGIENAKAGMYLVYTAMFMLNQNNGYLEGVLTEPPLTKDMLIERYNLGQTFLDRAVVLAPDDDRIHSWNISNRLRNEKLKTDNVSEKTLDAVLALAERSPIFHLFNALTMASDVYFGEDREQRMFDLVQLMSGKESPCWPPIFRRGEAKNCKTTTRTPFAFQGVTTYLGDAYLKRALQVMARDQSAADQYLESAKKTYKRLDFFLFRRNTNRWDLSANIDERTKLIEILQAIPFQKQNEKQKIGEEYLKSRSFIDIYTCRSCHQAGYFRKDLQVTLPKPNPWQIPAQ